MDLLYASRAAARHLLDTAVEYETPLGAVRVVGLEGLIALKSSEKPPDPQHLTGQLHILSAGGAAPRTPVAVDDPYRLLDDLMAVVEALCPVWPPREVDGPMNDMRL